ncbi:hypothetical protein Dsin_005290 [Dipteronia sinensis]|uniref:MADS-box domain-containing protein n=1 Tax=Dipteronia sinensis TaxID=43782 RepID=A0AAE0EEG7_9ROSI|nr:hypothetical protein Dsin_005290 [Dipteronia sinensis]
MGRVKLEIKRLESTSNRQVTYSKRRNGILKKAKELSILCDIDIVLLMFSPTGRPTLFHGQRSNIEEVIARFSQLTPQERGKRKLESLEALKKNFKKLDHDVNIQDFLGARYLIVFLPFYYFTFLLLTSTVMDKQTRQSKQKSASALAITTILNANITLYLHSSIYWSNPDKIDSMEHLRQMENSLRESISRIRLNKENLEKHQLLSLEYTSQGAQKIPTFQAILVSRALEKKLRSGNSGQADRMGHGDGALNELSISACLSLQLGEQYTYPPYDSLNMPDDKKLNTHMEMNLQGNPAAYQVNNNFGLSRPMYDNGHHDWVSAPGHCGFAMFDENSYHQLGVILSSGLNPFLVPCIVENYLDCSSSSSSSSTLNQSD